jgi:hypothetical protein
VQKKGRILSLSNNADSLKERVSHGGTRRPMQSRLCYVFLLKSAGDWGGREGCSNLTHMRPPFQVVSVKELCKDDLAIVTESLHGVSCKNGAA